MYSIKTLLNQTTRTTSYTFNPLNLFIQVRGAKKRAVGSRTNNKDSAGRRLGPKKHEGHFVKPGQIIMRQRGTRIHPGENVKIGKDHTIYAIEPGYVRFYYDPFHPLRKFVGVALTKEIKLPKPHFEPRLRRFGFVKVSKALEAKEIEDHMSRKEELAQPVLKEIEEYRVKKQNNLVKEIQDSLNNKFQLSFNEEEILKASQRLYAIYDLLKVELPLEEARSQCNFDNLYAIKLNHIKSDINECKTRQKEYIDFAKKIDEQVSIDFRGQLYKTNNLTEQNKLKDDILTELSSIYSNEIAKDGYKDKVERLIKTPGVFSETEQNDLTLQYLPKVIPYEAEGSLVAKKSLKEVPKGTKFKQIYDEQARQAAHYIVKPLS